MSNFFNMFLAALSSMTVLLSIAASSGQGPVETDAFTLFIRAVDPDNVLRMNWNDTMPHPCTLEWQVVKCSPRAGSISEIRLENLSLRGTIDADSLCELADLHYLSLASNLIRGTIPHSMSRCRKLMYLNLSSNLLTGMVPSSLSQLKDLQALDISNNHFTGTIPKIVHGVKLPGKNFKEEGEMLIYRLQKLAGSTETAAYRGRKLGDELLAPPPTSTSSSAVVDPQPKKPFSKFLAYFLIVVAIFIILGFFFSMFMVGMRLARLAEERKILKTLAESPNRTPPSELKSENLDKGCMELVFFVDEQERFGLDDLFEATADLRNQSLNSSLYKVVLKNNGVYAVKRLKKLQASFEEFDRTMRRIGDLKHPNILPLVGCSSGSEEKLLIYKFQSNGSLLKMLEDHIEGSREFSWRLRLSIAGGIARGLDFIYQNPNYQEIIPHGNLKLSNIMLGDNGEPLISEYGLSRFLDPKNACFVSSNGYAAPEQALSEQADVYSFGIILLELLTGKAVEKTGIDLPKWVRAMVREEWTGEVFDKEVSASAREFAFPLLNIALKCVSFSPDDRPSTAEVMEKIQEVLMANAHDDDNNEDDDASVSQDWSLLRTVIPETWDTPGSNY